MSATLTSAMTDTGGGVTQGAGPVCEAMTDTGGGVTQGAGPVCDAMRCNSSPLTFTSCCVPGCSMTVLRTWL